MKRLLLIAVLALAACGQETRLEVKDGICYRSSRSWAIWQYDHTIRPQSDLNEECK